MMNFAASVLPLPDSPLFSVKFFKEFSVLYKNREIRSFSSHLFVTITCNSKNVCTIVKSVTIVSYEVLNRSNCSWFGTSSKSLGNIGKHWIDKDSHSPKVSPRTSKNIQNQAKSQMCT